MAQREEKAKQRNPRKQGTQSGSVLKRTIAVSMAPSFPLEARCPGERERERELACLREVVRVEVWAGLRGSRPGSGIC